MMMLWFKNDRPKKKKKKKNHFNEMKIQGAFKALSSLMIIIGCGYRY